MNKRISRRDLLRAAGTSGLAAGLGSLGAGGAARADPAGARAGGGVSAESALGTRLGLQGGTPNPTAASVIDGRVIQPRRELPVLQKTDVLVVGGGPGGVAAAIAARRAGADVTLVERYGHFGGLWTGGLVLLVIGHWVTGKRQVCQGIGEEMMRRLEKIDGGIIDRRPGVNPTVDAEALKYLMVEMILEANVRVLLHCWGVDAVMEGDRICGAVFESKSGRQAILAKVVVDATGDGDLFAAAGAEYEHRKYRIGLVHRLGNLDKVDAAKAGRDPKPKDLGLPTPVPGVHWVNLQGPDADGVDVAELTRLELNHRRHIWRSVEKLRHTPGYEKVYLLETAPQLGVRITRVLRGTHTVTRKDLSAGTEFPDVVAVGGSENGQHGPWQVPYGALLPVKLDGLLAAGRCISAEAKMADLVRLIPNCFATGHAAGAAAAVAVQDRCRPRDVDVSKVQKLLRQQEAYLG